MEEDKQQIKFLETTPEDINKLRQWYKWRSPFTEDLDLLSRSLQICHPDAALIVRDLNCLCQRKQGEQEKNESQEKKGEEKEGKERSGTRGGKYSPFFTIASRVKQKAIQFYVQQKDKLSQQIPDSQLDLSSSSFCSSIHKSAYRADFNPIAIRLDLKSANYHSTQFLGMVEENLSYSSFIERWVREVQQKEPDLIDERDIERCINLIVQAKQLRQTMIGEAFKGSLNKVVKAINAAALNSLLKSQLWKEELSPLLSIDTFQTDEIVFIPKQKDIDPSSLFPLAESLASFYSNLTLEVGEEKNDKGKKGKGKKGEEEGKEEKGEEEKLERKKMCPVRVEVFTLSKVETQCLRKHPNLLNGTFGLVDKVLYPLQQQKIRLVNVPPELYLLFYKRVNGIEIEEKDYYFQHNGMVCRIITPLFLSHQK